MKLLRILQEVEITLKGGFAIATLMMWGLIALTFAIDLILWIFRMIRK